MKISEAPGDWQLATDKGPGAGGRGLVIQYTTDINDLRLVEQAFSFRRVPPIKSPLSVL